MLNCVCFYVGNKYVNPINKRYIQNNYYFVRKQLHFYTMNGNIFENNTVNITNHSPIYQNS